MLVSVAPGWGWWSGSVLVMSAALGSAGGSCDVYGSGWVWAPALVVCVSP